MIDVVPPSCEYRYLLHYHPVGPMYLVFHTKYVVEYSLSLMLLIIALECLVKSIRKDCSTAVLVFVRERMPPFKRNQT